MSRARLLRRLERLMAQVEALESVIDTRGLEALSDEELEALEAWYEEGEPERWEAWVAAWVSRTDLVVPDETPPEVMKQLPLNDEPEASPEAVPELLNSEEAKEGPRMATPRRSTDPPEPSPRRGEWWRVTFRPYRPPGTRARAAQERPFDE